MKASKIICFVAFLVVGLCSVSSPSHADENTKDTLTTTVEFSSLQNNELSTVCDLLGIEYAKMVCRDTAMRGKIFMLSIGEFKKGKLVKEDTLVVPRMSSDSVEVDGKMMVFIHDYTQTITFPKKDSAYSIEFCGRLEDDKFRLYVKYRGIRLIKTLKGNPNYILTTTNKCGENGAIVKINERMPLLAYTPPLKIGKGGGGSYCALRAEAVENWYKKCKVEHYYLIYLQILEPESR